ncbi:hypothetical protein [Actinocrinis sp.]|jgi:hypothetical protein|uniref:hypothetical protein n=1 Tax=Actinocrinis sp. TaxID=1920516 RepID=UPI002DDCF2AF|nr:hypothetical protein [Actinocrinis sp.]
MMSGRGLRVGLSLGTAVAGVAAVFATGAFTGPGTASARGAVAVNSSGSGTAAGPRSVSAADADVLYQAEQLMVRDCMARQGFTYFPVPRVPVPGDRQFPYVVDDVAWASAHGYGRDLQSEIEQQAAGSPGARYEHSLTPQRLQQFGQALYGTRDAVMTVPNLLGGTLGHDANGCAAQVWQQLYGNSSAWFAASETVQESAAIREGDVQRSAPFQQALPRWSACMRGRGLTAASPAQSRSQRLASHEPNAEQLDVRAAVAEAQCAQSTGLATLADHLDATYAATVYQQFKAQFDTMYALQVAALPRARSVVARG